jgi:hypothetical protein
MTTDSGRGEAVGSGFRADKTVKQLTMALAKVVDEKHGVNNGARALYWALIHVISQHAKEGHVVPTEGSQTYP